MFSRTGNRITDNALQADNGSALIERAILEIGKQHGWRPLDDQALFAGIYYDRTKVGSFITRVINDRAERAVLKIQLRPLSFDEGFIIRHVQRQITSKHIRLPKIISDEPWDESRGYGYLVMEDASDLPQLWAGHCPSEQELARHEVFLNEFMHHVLPISPYLSTPEITLKEKYLESLEHFQTIANASSHNHIDYAEIEHMKQVYLRCLERTPLGEFHFTHGHLSGMEIKEDRVNDSFVLFANLLWSFRPNFYEMMFPLWVDLMGIRDTKVHLQDILAHVNRWSDLWQRVQGVDPRTDQFFWFLILERSMMTVMLDLGASEWSNEERQQKQILLNVWKELFQWLVKEKF